MTEVEKSEKGMHKKAPTRARVGRNKRMIKRFKMNGGLKFQRPNMASLFHIEAILSEKTKKRQIEFCLLILPDFRSDK